MNSPLLAKAQVAVGLRALLERLPALELVDVQASLPQGTVMRGPARLDVRF